MSWITAVGTTAFAWDELAMMRAETPVAFASPMRCAHLAVWVIFVSLAGFVSLYLHAERAWLAWSVCALPTFSLFPNFLARRSLDCRQTPLMVTCLGHWWLCLLACVATALLPDSALAQTGTKGAPFLVKSWRTQDGLPQNSVQGIVQTPDGYLWIGTKGGLSRFDGVRFTNYGLADGLKSLNVRALAGDGAGGLWIGTLGGGLSHWRDGVIKSLTTADGLLHDDVYSLAPAEQGCVWVGTARGVQHWGPAGFTQIGEGEGLNGLVPALAASPKEGLWVSVESVGLFRFHEGRCERVALPPPCEDRHPPSLLVDAQGDVWAGMGDGIVLRRHNGAWIEYNESHGLPFSYIYCLAQGVGGEVWAGSHEQGLFVFRDGRFYAVPGTEASTRAVMVSSDGVIWLGTQSEGLNRLTPPRIMAYPLGTATESGEVNGIAEDPPGQFWVATWGGGLQRGPLEALKWVTDVPELREYPFLRSCLRTKSGDLYIIGSMQVGRRDAGAGALSFTPPTNVIANCACEEADGSLLLGGRDGVLRRLARGVMQPVSNGNFTSPIISLLRGKRPGVWVATQGSGLFQWNSGKVEHWTTAEGLPTDLLRALHEDAQGTLWIGTGGGGLAWLKKGRVHSLDSRQGLTNDAICPILEDDDGHLWLGSIRGISRVSKLELFDVAEGRATAVHPLVLDESDGMPSAECTSGYGPAGLRTNSGLLLFSTTRHIVAVDPKKFTASAPPPNVLIESVIADGKAMRSSTRELSLSPGLREVSIEYTAFNYTKPDRIRFRYRLKGMQKEWTGVGQRRVARFALLPPGRYTFEVSAANEDGRWNETGASLAFAVRPFFWQTAWFRFVVVVLLMASGGGMVAWWARSHIRQAQAREQLARAEAEAQQRRNEVAHLMRVASIGELSSAIAHELKQPLTAILSNAQAAQRFLAQDESDTAEVRDILHDIVTDDERAMDVIRRLRSLLKKGEFQPEALDVNELIHDVVRLMQGDMTARAVSVATALTTDLPPVRGDRVQLQQVLINLMLNAGHAMSEIAPDARTLTLRSSRGEGGVQICVDDTGDGIPAGSEEKLFEPFHTSKVEGLGLGLSVSRSIAVAHGGHLWAERRLEGGATFCFTLPEWKGNAT